MSLTYETLTGLSQVIADYIDVGLANITSLNANSANIISLTGSSAGFTSFTGASIFAGSGSFINLTTNTFNTSNLNVSGTGTFNNIAVNNLTGTQLYVQKLNSNTGTINNFNSTNGNIISLSSGTGSFNNLSSVSSTISYATIQNLTGALIYCNTGIFNSFTTQLFNTDNLSVSGTGSINNLTGNKGYFNSLAVTNYTGTTMTLNSLSSNFISADTLDLNNLSLTSFDADYAIINNLTGTIAGFTTFTGSNGNLNSLTSNYISADVISTDTLNLNSLSLISLDATYGIINNFTGSIISGNTGIFNYLSSTNYTGMYGTIDNLTTNNFSANLISTNSINSTTSNITSITSDNVVINSLTGTNCNLFSITSDNVVINNLTGNNGIFSNLEYFSSTGVFAYIFDLQVDSFVTNSFVADTFYSPQGEIDEFTSNDINCQNMTGINIYGQSYTGNTGYFNYLACPSYTGNSMSLFSLSSTNGNVGTLTGNRLNFPQGTISELNCSDIKTNNCSGTNFLGLTGSFFSMNATNSYVITENCGTGIFNNLYFTSATGNVAQINTINNTTLNSVTINSSNGNIDNLNSIDIICDSINTSSILCSTINTTSITGSIGTFNNLYLLNNGYECNLKASPSGSSTFTLPSNSGTVGQYLRTDGASDSYWYTPPSVNIVQATTTNQYSTTSSVTTSLTAQITPQSVTSSIRINVTANLGVSYPSIGSLTIYRGGTDLSGGDNFVSVQAGSVTTTISSVPANISFIDTPATTSMVTYYTVLNSGGGQPVYFNNTNDTCVINLEEIFT